MSQKALFKVDPEFASYWPNLPPEQFKILEDSICSEGLRENLIVWEEEKILLDGHQRVGILQKHKIPFADKITYMSFPDRLHAKRWVHLTQQGRRGEVHMVLRILHVLEFEPIYREEALKRKSLAGKKYGKTCVQHACLEKGAAREFMAHDAPAGIDSVTRLLYIRENDKELWADIVKRAKAGENPEIKTDYKGAQGIAKMVAAGIKANRKAILSIPSGEGREMFANAVVRHKIPFEAQEKAAKNIIKNKQTADANHIEDEVINKAPRRNVIPAAQPMFLQLQQRMNQAADCLISAVHEFDVIQELRAKAGDDIYYQALADATKLRAAFAEWVIRAKSFMKGENPNEKNEKSADKKHQLTA